MSYVCSCCGEVHDGLPDVAFEQPSFAQAVPKDEWTARVRLDADVCVVDDEHYFIRAVLEIPVHDYETPLGIGVWVSQKAENFRAYVDDFDSTDIGPFFGWLSNEFHFGGDSTLHLKTMAHFQGRGNRPHIELESTDHPLALAQRNGIGIDQAWTFVHEYLDRDSI